ncbi:MAG: bifunctional serine/threonine-protein kinase/formylglycine-generating enzyme family protein [Gemmataceae bacterium]
MSLHVALLKAVGKAVLNAAGGGLAGDVLCDVLPEVARKVCKWWGADRPPEERREEVAALAQASPAEVRQAVDQAVAAVAADQPAEVRHQLGIYLSLIPAAARASLRRPKDPSPPLDAFEDPESLLPLLPSRLPRFKPGDRPLSGIDWELEELLGSGGFGEVWKARNPHFDAVPPVALKFCLDPEAKDRLLRHEAAVLNQVMRQGRHPGIVALLHTYLSADPPCLEYEFVSGGDLAGLMQDWRGRPPGAVRVVRLMQQLSGILAFAHRLSPPIVHRDLKPANVLVQPAAGGEFTLRVADFGIGGVAARQAVAATARGFTQGQFLVTALRGAHTPLYASPQQMRGGPPDPRDDVYSLGVIWFQLLSGSLVTGRPGGTRWTGRLLTTGVPQAHVDLLASCLEDDPADRPADAGVLADQLAALLSERPAAPRPAVAPRPVMPELVDACGMRFRLIQPGSFLMGSPPDEPFRQEDEELPRTVRIDRPFYLATHPVTQQVYESAMKAKPSHFQKKNGGGPNHPVEQVSWADAQAFCELVSKQAGRRCRLPTEAEWEYACRAGSQTPFSFGEGLSSTQANFDGNRPYGSAEPGPFRQKTTPVGAFPPNAWGLYDLHGNVWEWCQDWYTPGKARALRGGSWNNSGHTCRSARRQKYAPGYRADNVGFRVVLEALE